MEEPSYTASVHGNIIYNIRMLIFIFIMSKALCLIV